MLMQINNFTFFSAYKYPGIYKIPDLKIEQYSGYNFHPVSTR
jgi:hypothetical protein